MISIGPAGFNQAPKLAVLQSAPATKVGVLLKGRQERFNLKRGWFVNAWRIVDEAGQDLVLPWHTSKKEARATAKALGIKLVECTPGA
jgi:hypothetical protein